jgi:Putative adhesin
MRTLPFVVSLTLCPALLFGIEQKSSSDNVKEEFHHTYNMQPGGRLDVSNFNGSVEVTGWDQNTIDVSGAKHAESQELLKAITVEVSVNNNLARVRSIRPEGMRGNMGVRYVIKVPRRTTLETVTSSNGRISAADLEGPARLRTSNGAVRASRIKGDLNAETSNGSVHLDDLDGAVHVTTSNGGVHCARIRGTVNATTSNGGVHVDLVESKPGEPVHVTTSNGGVDLKLGSMASNPVHAVTSNGGITVQMPSDASARVRAVVSSHGKVTSDFDVRREGPENRSRLEGQIGSGGALIELSTSNGGIHLKKL